ncbi:MAG: S8 family serine peptidase [Eubacterium sp.]
MKKRFLVLVMSMLMVFSSIPSAVFAQEDKTQNYGTEGVDYAPGQAIVCVNGGVAALNSNEKGRSAEPAYEIENLMDVGATAKTPLRSASAQDADQGQGTKSLALVKSGQDTESLIAELESNPNVEYAEPNYYIRPYTAEEPTDPGYRYQWSLKNQLDNGQTVANKGVDIKAPDAWAAARTENTQISQKPVVAVVDTGVDYNHPDLKNIMWDDGDKIPELTAMGGGKYGFNALGKTPGEVTSDPMDKDIGHGTHCAGIIASQWNDVGMAGVADVEIMAVRMLSSGNGDIAGVVKAYNYIQAAAENGVNVAAVNNSWGGSSYDGVQLRSVSTAATAMGKSCDIISCFAAGNANSNCDLNTGSITKSPYILNVGAMESQGHRASFSSYGKESVEVFAPGTEILSTITTDTEAVPMKEHLMPTQYLPQLGPDNQDKEKNASYYYENFESGEPYPVRLRLLNANGEEKATSESLTPGRASANGLQLNLDSIAEGEKFTIEMVFNRKILEAAQIDTQKDFNFAFSGGFENAMFGKNMLLQYQEPDGNWKSLNTTQQVGSIIVPVGLAVMDYNWNQASGELNLPDFMKYGKETNSDVVLRMIPKQDNDQDQGVMTGRTEGESAVFRFDDVGFGKSASDYAYAYGTSMATPVVTGLASLLSSQKGADGERAYNADEVIARIKGGVNREDANEDLIDKSISNGFINAAAAVEGNAACVPVLNNLETANGKATLTGYFFGNEKGTLKVGESAIEETEIKEWTTDTSSQKSTITFNMPANIGGKQEITVIPVNKDYGRGFFNVTADTKGYEVLNAPGFKYNVENLEISSKDLYPIAMAATDSNIAYLATIYESNQFKMNLYNIDKNEWENVSLPDKLTKTDSIAGGLTKFYMLYTDVDGRNNLGIYEPNQKKWSTVPTELNGSERLVVYKDQLLAIGGRIVSGEGNTKVFTPLKSVSIIDPTTGKIKGSLPDLPEARNTASVSASGNNIIVQGGNNGINGFGPETINYSNTMIYNGKEWKDYGDDFLNNKNPIFNKEQTFDIALCALDTGAIAVGPVSKFQTADMKDTWNFDQANGNWSGDSNLLYSQSKTTSIISTAAKGKFYVLGLQNSGETGLIFRSTEVKYTGPIADPSGSTPVPDPKPDPDPVKPDPTVKPADTKAVGQNIRTGLIGSPAAIAIIAATVLILLGTGIVIIYKKRNS